MPNIENETVKFFNNLDRTKPIEDILADIAVHCLNVADSDGNPPMETMAHELSALALDVQDNYVYLARSGDTPTVAQGVALSRLLRGSLDPASRGSALITTGGSMGLPHNYLAVRFTDGYQAGISPEGEIST